MNKPETSTSKCEFGADCCSGGGVVHAVIRLCFHSVDTSCQYGNFFLIASAFILGKFRQLRLCLIFLQIVFCREVDEPDCHGDGLKLSCVCPFQWLALNCVLLIMLNCAQMQCLLGVPVIRPVICWWKGERGALVDSLQSRQTGSSLPAFFFSQKQEKNLPAVVGNSLQEVSPLCLLFRCT